MGIGLPKVDLIVGNLVFLQPVQGHFPYVFYDLSQITFLGSHVTGSHDDEVMPLGFEFLQLVHGSGQGFQFAILLAFLFDRTDGAVQVDDDSHGKIGY